MRQVSTTKMGPMRKSGKIRKDEGTPQTNMRPRNNGVGRLGRKNKGTRENGRRDDQGGKELKKQREETDVWG